MKTTRNFADVIRHELSKNPQLAEEVACEGFKSNIAQQLYNLRKERKLSRKKLAEIINTNKSICTPNRIKNIEETDYEGEFPIDILLSVAWHCGKKLIIKFEDKNE